MAEQQSQVFTKVLEMQAQVIADVKKSKQKLIVIVLEATDAESRLRKLGRTLLEAQMQNGTEILNEDISISSMCSNVKELSVNQLEDLTEMIRKVFEPALTYNTLIHSIGEVMRQSDMTNETKIDRISDLLI